MENSLSISMTKEMTPESGFMYSRKESFTTSHLQEGPTKHQPAEKEGKNILVLHRNSCLHTHCRKILALAARASSTTTGSAGLQRQQLLRVKVLFFPHRKSCLGEGPRFLEGLNICTQTFYDVHNMSSGHII